MEKKEIKEVVEKNLKELKEEGIIDDFTEVEVTLPEDNTDIEGDKYPEDE